MAEARRAWRRADPLLRALPYDVVELIVEHGCALVVQRAALSFIYEGHRRRRAWAQVARRFDAATLAVMTEHAWIRRELRVEPESWLQRACPENVVAECLRGEWGPSQRGSMLRRGFGEEARSGGVPVVGPGVA